MACLALRLGACLVPFGFVAASVLGALSTAAAEPVVAKRYGELTATEMAAFLAGESEVVVEFRQGDHLTLDLKSTGDLLVTDERTPVTLRVAQTFYVKAESEALLVSRDGTTFRPLSEAVAGHLRAAASGDDDGRVRSLQLELDARLRNDP